MDFRKFGSRYFVRIDKGEEVVGSLKRLCEENGIRLGTVAGIGATNRATVGLFEPETKEYSSAELSGNFEIAPLHGNISTMAGKTYLHLHANLCDKEHRSFGGHLNSAIVSATFEAVVDAFEGRVDRAFSGETGLNLLKFGKKP